MRHGDREGCRQKCTDAERWKIDEERREGSGRPRSKPPTHEGEGRVRQITSQERAKLEATQSSDSYMVLNEQFSASCPLPRGDNRPLLPEITDIK